MPAANSDGLPRPAALLESLIVSTGLALGLIALARGVFTTAAPSPVRPLAAADQGTPPPPGCITTTPPPTPTATPTSYRLYDAVVQIAASAPRVAPGETFQVMAAGSSPFAYRFTNGASPGIRFTGAFTHTGETASNPSPCTVGSGGFTCGDPGLRPFGGIGLYADAVAQLPAAGSNPLTLCVRIESPPPFGSGRDTNPGNDSDCVSIEVLPDAAPAPRGDPGGTNRLAGSRPAPNRHRSQDPPIDQPASPTASRTVAASPTPTATPSPTITPTPTVAICASPTATYTPTATPTSIRMFDASLEVWSNVPRVEAGNAVRFVVQGDLAMKWRIDGTLEGPEGVRLTGAYTFSHPSSLPPHRCEVEARRFACDLDTPDDVYRSEDEDVFLDAAVDPLAAPGRITLCAEVRIMAPRGSGGDPNGANNRRCVDVAIIPPRSPTPTEHPTPSRTPRPAGTTQPPRLWVPFAQTGPGQATR